MVGQSPSVNAIFATDSYREFPPSSDEMWSVCGLLPTVLLLDTRSGSPPNAGIIPSATHLGQDLPAKLGNPDPFQLATIPTTTANVAMARS